MINWDDYRFLLAMERTGSLSAAARYLGVSQPTVSRRISELEKTLGAILIERLPDGYKLSAAGTKVCERAKAIEQKTQEIQNSVLDDDDRPLRQIVVSASEGVSAALVVPALNDLRQSHPDLVIELIISNRPMDLRRREADIAIRLGEPWDEALIARKIGRVEFGLFIHQEMAKRLGLPTTENDLAGFPFIESGGEIAHVPQANRLRNIMLTRNKSFCSNSILNQLAAFKAGLGILSIPTYLTEFVPEAVRILEDDFKQHVDLRIMYHAPIKEKPGVRPTLDILASAILKRLSASEL